MIVDPEGFVLEGLGIRGAKIDFFDQKDETAEKTDDLEDTQARLKVRATLGDSAHLLVGQKILAIGNPFGLERTLTTGVVSAAAAPLPPQAASCKGMIFMLCQGVSPASAGGRRRRRSRGYMGTRLRRGKGRRPAVDSGGGLWCPGPP